MVHSHSSLFLHANLQTKNASLSHQLGLRTGTLLCFAVCQLVNLPTIYVSIPRTRVSDLQDAPDILLAPALRYGISTAQ